MSVTAIVGGRIVPVDTEPIEACHRGGSEGDPTLVIRKLGGGFVDLDSTADLGKRECSTRTSDSTPNH